MPLDPDIQAAFSDQPQASAPAGNIDPDIAQAFQNQGEITGLHAPSTGSEHLQGALDVAYHHPFTAMAGLGENVLSGITGSIGRTAQRVMGQPATYQGYQPHLEAGKEIQQLSGQESQRIGGLATEGMTAAGISPENQKRAGEVFGTITDAAAASGLARSGVNILRGAAPETAAIGGNRQSISAAAATHDISTASPELQAAVKDAGGNVNQEVLGRHIEAESLPVPAKLTKGQATQDSALISMEQNARGKNPAFAERFNEQNQNLADNLQSIRESVGPDVFSTNPVEHGETLIKAYKDKAAAADADIGSKYQALRDANGGKFPIDAKSLNSNVGQALHDKLLFEHAPSAEMNQLAQAANKDMTFEQYEAMRTNLARVMRSSTDGNERAAAGVIRQEMEKLPMTGDAARLKPLADTARSAAKAQFDALDADPAYKAAVNGTVSPDRFVSRFIVNGDRDNVARMRQNFADNPTAQQTMGVAALDHLRNSARIDDLYRGNFAQASYNKNLQALDPKMSTLFSPKDAGDIRALGNVARYQQSQPRGSFVNNSNTATTQMAENARTALEGIANVKTGGLYGGVLKPILKGREAKKMAEEHLSVGAGLDYPSR